MKPLPDSVRLRRRLGESLTVALNARDSVAVAAFRSAMSAIDNAEAVDRSHAQAPTSGVIGGARVGLGAGEVARRELTVEDVVAVLRAEVADRTAAAAEYEGLGRAEQAGRLRAEASVLSSFLDNALSDL